jgi:isopenicillin N synthase-like dioxygenase
VSTTIPTIDLSARPETVLLQLDQAFQVFGFCICTHTGMASTTIAEAFEASRRFHTLDVEEKNEISINQFHRGYIAPKSNTTLTSSVAQVTKPNTSGSLMIMHEVPEDDPRFGHPLQGPNQWPAAIPGFRETVEAYRADVEILARQLTAMQLKILGVGPDLYDRYFQQPTEFLRLLHYEPEPEDVPTDSFGSAPHTDHGFLTIVVQDDVGGLEVQTRDNDWLPARPASGSVVVNVGDMLAHLSGGRWRSSPHRVKNTFNRERFSIAYFFDPAMTVDMVPVTGDGGIVNYGDYILSKFDSNYGYRSTSG